MGTHNLFSKSSPSADHQWANLHYVPIRADGRYYSCVAARISKPKDRFTPFEVRWRNIRVQELK
jgi:hypothetical protein